MTGTIAEIRLERGLRGALGKDVAYLLDDSSVTDILLNTDGRLWVDRLDSGRVDSGFTMSSSNAEFALRMLSSHSGNVLTNESPILSATIPGSGERVAGTISPITRTPTFAIRVPPRQVFGLAAFERTSGQECRQSTAAQRIEAAGTNMGLLLRAIEERKNLLICGGTGSGKTSLLSSILQLESIRRDRVLALEDTRELNLEGIPDHARLMTSASVNMAALLKLSLRMRPDRIIVGEFRDGATALSFLHACNTGHSGSLGTIHANSCADAIGRLEDLCGEVCAQTPVRAIRSAIGCVVHVVRTSTGRAIKEVWSIP